MVKSFRALCVQQPHTIGGFNEWWRSLSTIERREIETHLFDRPEFKSGLSDAFRAGQYGKGGTQ